ncbi:cobalamin B12-binding domain-containing protein [Desulfoscipio geothermicus]|nr:corrinoid protein [Desulfoscipio geothermicus]
MQNFSSIAQAVIEGDVGRVQELVNFALGTKLCTPEELLTFHLLPGMDEIGRQFKANEIHIPEVLLSSRALQAGVIKIKHYFPDNSAQEKAKVLLGTVAGDLHDIGKRLVGIFLKSSGFQVIDVGIDVAPEDFVRYVKEYQPDVLGMSALLNTTMIWMGETIKLLKKQKLIHNCKVIVGGNPVTPEFARQIGADGYAETALDAVSCTNKLLGLQ